MSKYYLCSRRLTVGVVGWGGADRGLALVKVPSKALVHQSFPVGRIILKPRHYKLRNHEATRNIMSL